ncbi:cellulose-growth-specific protein [Sporothrix schenckii 1099-18]|uniref:lytic cellulose monooxygenase (C4-dehydrogenating) n=1 Tax=Sporothrix schenckii 1099-18 TaxID=1397361 RepID=A0A0F2MLG4_SPOSC|nr:cellulose-growth-specific protein [Sporothrix schenckii 1099-18]KJR89909.1 cellulose-growth-specific protein [Sporothrix schenckii 1099-18]
MKDLHILPLLSLVSLAAGHGAVTSYVIGGKTYNGYDGFAPSTSGPTIQRQWPDYNPILSSTSPMMTCNGGTSAQLSAPIAAGDNITAVWKQWTHQQGPVMVWMYKCEGDFSSCTGSGKNWFKIDQLGLTAPPLTSANWGTAVVCKNLKWSSVIPKQLAPGNYLIRHELLALHQTNTPQFYPECAQLVVSGSGTALPPANHMYSIPTYASMTDPGVMVRTPVLQKLVRLLCILPSCPFWRLGD